MPRFKEKADSISRLRIRLRLQAFDLLGKECKCCGEKHPLLLTFDHIKEDGGVHRKHSCPSQVLRDILADPQAKENYQVLCTSCNMAKHIYGECPHKSGISIEATYESMRKRSAIRKVGDMSQLSRRGSRWVLRENLYPWLQNRFRSTR